jgi:hypothetical protein
MPRKTKEQKDLKNKENNVKTSTTNTKKTSNTEKKPATKSKSKSKSKNTTTKKKSSSKSVKKVATKKSTTTNTSKRMMETVEYYDLPYRYNQTVVKVLAQTPTTLFIYWDISDNDIEKFKEKYGNDFFETTEPVLIIYNDTLNYQFEVKINDFANSWYLHVADSKCDYRVELGRKPIRKTEKLDSDYIYVSTSNEIESPNDHILFDKHQKMVYFKNVKTGSQTEKSINNLSFITNMGKIYDIYDLYKGLYKSENVEGIYDSSNPSS